MVLGLAACGPRGYGAGSSTRPPALPPGVTVPMWEHFCGSYNGDDGLIELLDDASRKGWEMATFVGTTICFKRPRTDSAPATEPRPAAPAPVAAPTAG